MGALIERRRILRERLTIVIGKVEDFLLIKQPPIRELTDLLKTLIYQNDTLENINREKENIGDLEKLETEMFDAFDFQGRVISAKLKLEMKITHAITNGQARIASVKAPVWSQLR